MGEYEYGYQLGERDARTGYQRTDTRQYAPEYHQGYRDGFAAGAAEHEAAGAPEED